MVTFGAGSTAGITATAGSILDGNGVANNFTGGTLNLTARNNVGSSADALELAVSTLNATATTGGLYVSWSNAMALGTLNAATELNLTQATGDMTIGSLTAPTISLNATVGSILDGNGPTVNITATTANLAAQNSIGTSTDAIETTVGTLNAAATSGSIFISEEDAMTLNNITAASEVNVTTHNDGIITINSIVADIVNLTVLSSSRAPSSGSIVAGSGTGINIRARVTNLNARGDIGQSSDPLRTTIGTVVATAAGGGIYINETDALILENLFTSGNISVTTASGDLTVGGVTASGAASAVTLNAASGGILDGNAGEANVTAFSASFQSANSVGIAGDPLEVSLSQLYAAATTGGIFLNGLGNLTLNRVASASDLSVTAAQNLTLILASAVGNAALTATSGSILSGNPGGINLTAGGSASLIAGNVVGTSAAPLGVNVPGQLNLSAYGSIDGVSANISGNAPHLNPVYVSGRVQLNNQDFGGGIPSYYLQAISNADNPFIANVPDFYTVNHLIFIVSTDEEEDKRSDLIYSSEE